jgi:hypothetical protein
MGKRICAHYSGATPTPRGNTPCIAIPCWCACGCLAYGVGGVRTVTARVCACGFNRTNKNPLPDGAFRQRATLTSLEEPITSEKDLTT